MDNTIQALQNLYVALGGKLTDTYETIADGATVANLITIPAMINAIAQLDFSKMNQSEQKALSETE